MNEPTPTGWRRGRCRVGRAPRAAGGIDVSNVESRGLDTAVEQSLAAAGVSPEFRANVMQGFRSSPELADRRMERRRLDDRFADLAAELFEMLDATWPGWHYDATDNTVAFDDPETGERYTDMLSQMEEVNRRREALRSPDAGQAP